MKAVVYHGPAQRSVEDVPEPHILTPSDAIVEVTTTTICGSDLHILKGDVPAVQPGTIIGHEAVGIVKEVGASVTKFKPGDRVLCSCVNACGVCSYCRKNLPSHCLGEEGTSGIGWIQDHLINGTQAEYIRMPYADNSMYHIPDNVSNEAALMLCDILPTGFEIGVMKGKVQPGDVVAIVGAGPIGLSTVMTCDFYGPSRIIVIDLDPSRLDAAKEFGATNTVLSSSKDWIEQVNALTDGGLGVDVAIEAVGIPQTFDMCTKIVRPGGAIANVGVHGKPVELHLEDLWIHDINISTGLVSTTTIPMLLKLVAQNKIDPSRFISHRFNFDEFDQAWDTFSNAKHTKALKVLITKESA
ncbi:MAG: zinc-dependent alcohol dehydrogenase family protein [Actinomycetaceae bacterium]|nr:zinc-dependent alcohol dehydrogenase family protein [Actinomycetaceae bacterium]